MIGRHNILACRTANRDISKASGVINERAKTNRCIAVASRIGSKSIEAICCISVSRGATEKCETPVPYFRWRYWKTTPDNRLRCY